MSYRNIMINDACKGCLNQKAQGGKCPGAKPGDFYYPTECDSFNDGSDTMEIEDEALEEMTEQYEADYDAIHDEWENDEEEGR